MALMVLIATMLAGAQDSAPVPPKTPPAKVCERPFVRTIDPGQSVMPRPLTEEPPAERIYSVLNTVDGCMEPVRIDRREAR